MRVSRAGGLRQGERRWSCAVRAGIIEWLGRVG